MENQELSFGQKAVGVTFNPNGSPSVNSIKEASANLIDILNGLRSTATQVGDNESARMYSIAITDIQTGQMWGVKAATWQP